MTASATPYDLLVVGGGINGCGIARDAAGRGLRVLLVEQGDLAGATSSAAAVEQFLSAAKAQDLQAMSAVWGNAVSPMRERVDRQELERRLLIMTCHLRHDTSRIGAAQPAVA